MSIPPRDFVQPAVRIEFFMALPAPPPGPSSLARPLRRLALLALCSLVPAARNAAASDVPRQPQSAQQIVGTLLANEQAAIQHKEHYAYLSEERSDRTAGHLWTEKVVETDWGKVRMLRAIDGRPLTPEQEAQERGRLAAIVADPSAWEKRERNRLDDEAHARQLLAYVQKAFLFSTPVEQGPDIRLDFHPNPAYAPQSMEERVLHGASGYMLIDAADMRLHYIEARLPDDVNIGFGLLATVRAGSSFSTTREPTSDPEWKTTQLNTAISGRVIFFKSIARNEHAEHSHFVRVPDHLTVAQAVALAEEP